MLNEQLKNLLGELELPYYDYYIPSFASCPICGGGELRITQTLSHGNRAFTYLVCADCHTGGGVEEWLRVLKEGADLNRNKSMFELYGACVDEFTENYLMNENHYRDLGYYSREAPSGSPFSIISSEACDTLGYKPTVKKINYLLVPLFRHVGLMFDLLIYDVSFRSVLNKRREIKKDRIGFCGDVRRSDLEKVFVAPTILDMVRVAGKRQLEGVDPEDFPLMTDISRKDAKGMFCMERIRADDMIFLREGDSEKPVIPKKAVGSSHVLNNHTRYNVGVIARNWKRLTVPGKHRTALKPADRKDNSYRFFIDGHDVYAGTVLNNTRKRVKEDDAPVQIIKGLIHIEKTGDSYRVRFQNNANQEITVLDNVPKEIIENRKAFNSYLLKKSEAKVGERFSVILLAWFDNHAIIPYLSVISERTAEVLTKEVRDGRY